MSFCSSCFGTLVLTFGTLVLMVRLLKRFRRIAPLSVEAVSRLQRQTVLITGASSGLGEELARLFYQHGCKLILASRRREELERVKQDLIEHSGSSAVRAEEPAIVILDLGIEDQQKIETIAQEIITEHGPVDIVVNNAGISSRATALETTIDVDRRMMLVNYLNQIALTKVMLRSMLSQNTRNNKIPANIVSISSVQGRMAIPYRSSYSASKHALQAFYDSLRAELSVNSNKTRKVEVTVVSPGYIRTNLSLNALTGDGSRHAQMDQTTANGMPPEQVATRVVDAMLNRDQDLVLSDWKPKVMIPLRALWPGGYFWVMNQYAKKK